MESVLHEEVGIRRQADELICQPWIVRLLMSPDRQILSLCDEYIPREKRHQPQQAHDAQNSLESAGPAPIIDLICCRINRNSSQAQLHVVRLHLGKYMESRRAGVREWLYPHSIQETCNLQERLTGMRFWI